MAISKKSFVNLDLQGNSLVNPTIGLNSNMTKEGSFQYNAAEFRLEYFNGTLVEQVANLTDIAAVTGGLIFQGGYDPTTNTPDITVDNGTVLKGFFWVATAAGTFLGENVQVGDSIIAKQDNPGTTAANWLILQGNVVIATDTVDGIVRLATQAEVDAGTEGGAVVLTPATFAASQQLADINTDITNLENDKLSRDGSQAMTGDLNMGNFGIQGLDGIVNNPSDPITPVNVFSRLDLQNNLILNVGSPENNTDAANKQYVDGAASTAQANAEAYADSLAPNYDPAGAAATAESNANTYTDNQIAAQSYSATIATGDWTLNAGVYEYTITHNLGSYVTFTAFYDGATADFNGSYAANTLTVYSNSLPSANTVVNVVKASGNI